MFRFAHYVFGLDNNENINSENHVNLNDMTQTNVDDDWILIDVGLESKGDDNCNDRPTRAVKDKTTTLTVPNTAQHNASAQYHSYQADNDSPTPAQAMDESWFVTPPPCFNSQLAAVVETTPFENLLIEHPSMSVFGPSMPTRNHLSLALDLTPSSSSSSTLSSPSTSSSNSIILLNQQQNRQARRQRQQQIRNNNQNNINIASRAAFFNDLQFMSAMQNAEIAQIQKSMTKTNMDRQNKAALQRNKPQSRKAKMAMRPNGSYNNRNNC